MKDVYLSAYAESNIRQHISLVVISQVIFLSPDMPNHVFWFFFLKTLELWLQMG